MAGNIEYALQPPPSHLSQVPNEILAQIFTAGTEEWRIFNPGGLPFPVLVSAVCRHWHVVSHSAQNLWTFIVPPLKKNPTDCLRWTSEWIRRSGEMAISVIIDDTLSFTPGLNASVEDLIDPETLAALILSLILQVDCPRRLHRIDVCLENVTLPIIKAMENLSASKPPLQQISICSRGGHRRYLGFSPTTEFSWLQSLPDLIKFRFQDSSCRPATLPGMNGCALPYISNLTSLDLSRLRPTHSDLEHLFAAPQSRLQHLVLRHLHPNMAPTPNAFSPIRTDTLRTIAVSTAQKIRGDQDIFLFSLLIIPNLTYLEIDSDIRISNLFGNSLSTSKIDTLKLINRLPISLAHREQFPQRYKEDMDILRSSFSYIKHLELIRLGVSSKLLLSGLDQGGTDIPRKRSINFRHWAHHNAESPEIAAPERSSLVWPHLRSITLDTMFAEDVKSMIDFTKRHKHVQEITLSSTAMRNLVSLGRKGEEIILPIPGLFKYREGMTSGHENFTRDVSEWLRERVKLVQSECSKGDISLWESVDHSPLSRPRSVGEFI